jgi:CHAD domain-containing protein
MLKRALPSAAVGDPEALHKARVATRQLRSVLPLVERRRQGRAVEADVRHLTRLLGPIRELDVAAATLKAISAGRRMPPAAVRLVRRAIESARRTVRQELRSTIGSVRIGKLKRRALKALRRGADDGVDGRTGREAWHAVAVRAEAVMASVVAAGSGYDPAALHEVRIAAKKLRYAFEAATEVAPASNLADVTVLPRVQDVLGRMHDLQVLADISRRVGESLPDGASVRAGVDALVSELHRASRRLHRGYRRLSPDLVAASRRVRVLARRLSSERAA